MNGKTLTQLNMKSRAFLVAQMVKRLQCRRPGFDSWVRKIPWRRKWQSTPALLPGKFHGWRSLIGYSPWGRKESDTTEQLQQPMLLNTELFFTNFNVKHTQKSHSTMTFFFQLSYLFFIFFYFILFLNFTILYQFCQISK